MQPTLRRVLLVAGGLLVLLVAVVVLGVDRAASRRWREMETQVARVRAALEAADWEREPLVGPSTDGRAFDHYEEAAALLGGIADVRDRARAAARASDDAGRAARDALLVEAEPALEALRRGARARDARPWRGEFAELADFRAPIELLVVADLAVARLRADVEAGRAVAGVERLADAMQFGRDLARSPRIVDELLGAHVVLPEALLEHLADGGYGALAVDARERLLEIARALEADLPLTTRAWHAEPALMVSLLVEDGDVDVSWRAELLGDAWYYGFSDRWMFADYALRALATADEIDAAMRADPAAGLRLAVRRQEELVDDPNPLVRTIGATYGRQVRRAHVRARLGMLRHALELDAGLPTVAPDPFGTGVRVERAGGAPTVVTTDPFGEELEVRLGR